MIRRAFSQPIRNLLVGIIMSLALFKPEPTEAFPRKTGTGYETALIGSELIRIYRYRPKGCEAGPILFVFPGYERNAKRTMMRARRIARTYCLTVFAPKLDEERFPRARYQRAGVVGDRVGSAGESCMGLFLRRLIAWAREHEGRPDAPYLLFGHSAGAQLLSRVSAFCPMPEALRIVIANPSSYVAPSLVEPTPYGFAGIADMAEREQRLRDYLALPLTIYLGANDVGDERLDESAAANRQGSNRYRRGRAVFAAAEDLAKVRGWAFHWRLIVVPGVGHSSKRMLAAPELATALGLSDR